MEEEILSRIAQAEARAAQIKEEAQSRAAAIVAEAQKQAQEIAKNSEVQAAAFRKEGMQAAEAKAQSDYLDAINKCSSQAKQYADGLLAHADEYVLEVVGRLTK